MTMFSAISLWKRNYVQLHRVMPLARQYPETRNIELRLLGYCYIVLLAGVYILVRVFHRSVNLTIIGATLGFIAITLLIHITLRLYAPFANPILYPVSFTLIGLGLLMQLRLDYEDIIPGQPYGASPTFALKSLLFMLWAAIITILFLVLCSDHKILSYGSKTLGFIGLWLLILPAFLPNYLSRVDGCKTWITLINFPIQPVAFAKIFLLISAAGLLHARRTSLQHTAGAGNKLSYVQMNTMGYVPIFSLGIIVLLITENDIGLVLLLYFVILILLLFTSAKLSWLLSGIAFFIGSAAVSALLSPSLRTSLQQWWDFLLGYSDGSYQISQSLFGLGTGGVAGTGLGFGRPSILPHNYDSFILTSLGEELGECGLAAIIILFLILITIGIQTALSVRNSFGKLLSAGISALLFIQIVINFCHITGVIPATSLATPFLSYNWSELSADMILIAILARISSDAREPAGLVNDHGSMVARSLTELFVQSTTQSLAHFPPGNNPNVK